MASVNLDVAPSVSDPFSPSVLFALRWRPIEAFISGRAGGNPRNENARISPQPRVAISPGVSWEIKRGCKKNFFRDSHTSDYNALMPFGDFFSQQLHPHPHAHAFPLSSLFDGRTIERYRPFHGDVKARVAGGTLMNIHITAGPRMQEQPEETRKNRRTHEK